MKVYPDANVYLAYLLGEKNEGEAVRFFQEGIDCKFSLVVSNTLFGEIIRRSGDSSRLLIQDNLDKFREAKKMEIVDATPEEREEARKMDEATGKIYGRNDYLHALLAERYADAFVSEDSKFRGEASKRVRTIPLREFLLELKA